MHFAKCEHNDCIKKDNCDRYINATAFVVNYKAICYEPDYKWYEPIEKEIVEALDNKEKKELEEPKEDDGIEKFKDDSE